MRDAMRMELTPEQFARIVQVRIEADSLDNTSVKVHLVAAVDRTAVAISLSAGQDHDAPHGRQLLRQIEPARALGI